MKLLEDINKIVNLLEPLNFKLIELNINNQILEYLVIKNEKITIVLEVSTFSRSYEFKISEEVEYTYDRNGCIVHIVHAEHSLHLSPSQTEPDLETIIKIIKETFKAELREIKLNELI
jgi:hypothetical protein